MRKHSVFVIVPAYNEAPRLAESLAPLISMGYTVVVIDDGSRDGSWEVLGSLPVVRLRHLLNLGQGAALQTGMDFARDAGADIVVHFDADGQHEASQIPGLLAPILAGEADVALGSRFLRRDDARRVPPAKRIALRVGILVSAAFTGVWLSDTHNGFRALSRKAMERVRLRERGYAHATEILAQIRHAGLRYVEVPTTIKYTDYSKSKGQPLSNAALIVLDLLARKLLR